MPPFAPQPQSWRTIDEPDVRRIIGDLVDFPRRRNSDPIGPWIEALTVIRLGLVEPEEVEGRYDGDVDGLAATWPAYRQMLERRGAVDFDDQIYRALLVLLRDPTARRAAQRACRVMLVDEFQDLTPAHLLMIRLLAAPGGAVFGVGDDDQTIYGYNGADPAWLIDFAELFPGSGEHPLEVNYRCPAGVVDVVDRLLRHNQRRVSKTIRAASTDAGGWSIDSGRRRRGCVTLAPSNRRCRPARRPPTSPCSHGSTHCSRRCRWRWWWPACRSQAGSASSSPTAPPCVPCSPGCGWPQRVVAARLLPTTSARRLRRPSRSFHPRITDWVSEQSSVVDLNKLAGRLNNERDAERVIDFAADVQTMQKMVASGATTSDLLLTLIDEIGLAGSVATLDANRRGMNRSAQGDDLTAVKHLAALARRSDDLRAMDAQSARGQAARPAACCCRRCTG